MTEVNYELEAIVCKVCKARVMSVNDLPTHTTKYHPTLEPLSTKEALEVASKETNGFTKVHKDTHYQSVLSKHFKKEYSSE